MSEALHIANEVTFERVCKYAKIIRIIAGITQRDLCHHMRKDNGFVSRVELGKDKYSTDDVDNLIDIAVMNDDLFESREQIDAISYLFCNYIIIDNVVEGKRMALTKIAEYAETVKDKIMRTNLKKEIEKMRKELE